MGKNGEKLMAIDKIRLKTWENSGKSGEIGKKIRENPGKSSKNWTN